MEALEAAQVVKTNHGGTFLVDLSWPKYRSGVLRAKHQHLEPGRDSDYGPDSMITARPGIQLEGVPYGERGPDCWGVEISCELGVLKAIPGWYLEC